MHDALTLSNGNTTHICNASNLTGVTVTNEQIPVGDLNGDPYTLILPVSGQWLGGMTEGTSCTIKQYGGGSIVGASPNSGVPAMFAFGAANTSSLRSIFCLVPGGTNDYVYDQGFAVVNHSGGPFQGHVTASGMGSYLLGPFYDQTTFDHVGFFDDLDTYAAYITGFCCNAKFVSSQFNGNYGSIPVYIDSTPTVGNGNLEFIGTNFVHPPPGRPAFDCVDTGAHLSVVSVDHAYTETSETDKTTAIYQNNGCGALTLNDVMIKAYAHGMTAPAVEVAATANSQVVVTSLSMRNGEGDFYYPATAVVNNYTKQAVKTDAIGNAPPYSSVPASAAVAAIVK
jgi:hypothetical protein